MSRPDKFLEICDCRIASPSRAAKDVGENLLSGPAQSGGNACSFQEKSVFFLKICVVLQVQDFSGAFRRRVTVKKNANSSMVSLTTTVQTVSVWRMDDLHADHSRSIV
jgi:hypothetical protein